MSPVLIIANVLSFIGNLLFTLSSILKSKKKILLFQSTNHVLAIISEFMTSAYSGMVQEFSSLARNIVLLFVKDDKKKTKLVVSLIFLVIAVVGGVLFNIFLSNNVWYGYLPICATIVYSSFVIFTFVKDMDERIAEILIKIGLIFNSIFWLTYGFFVKLYPVIIFNCLTLILSVITIVVTAKALRREKREKALV